MAEKGPGYSPDEGRPSRMRTIDSRDSAVRRSTRRATRTGSPQVRVSFLRSSPGHIARARLRTSPPGAAAFRWVRLLTSTLLASFSLPIRRGGSAMDGNRHARG